MAYRYTNTEKWNDNWFSELKQFEKLLFMYLCDNCDIAGFYEINYKRIENDLTSKKETIKGAFKGLSRGLIFNETEEYIYIRNFLKHQKNTPLNELNKAHLGIIKRFELYKNKFNIDNIESFINQDVKPLARGYGIGNGNEDIVTPLKSETNITWRTDFEIYILELNRATNKLLADSEWFSEREKFHPSLDIKLSMSKSYKDFWATEAGWKNKKATKSKEIDWKRTYNNALTQKMNQVYKNGNSNLQSASNFGNPNNRTNTGRLTPEDKRANLQRFGEMAERVLQEYSASQLQ